jgi:hypothetical protein
MDQVVDVMADEPTTVDLASQGMALAMREMMANGPARPTHAPPVTMTRAELLEQKAREAEGLPSRVEDAQRVVALEKSVNTILEQNAQLLHILASGNHGPPTRASSNHVPDHLRQEAIPAKSSNSSATLKTSPSDYLDEVPLRLVNEDDCFPGEEDDEDEIEEPVAKVPAPGLPLGRDASFLIQQTKQFLATKDSHKFFRSLLANGVHKNIGYTGWLPAQKLLFDKHFRDLLTNENLLVSLCNLIMTFTNGPTVSARGAASLIAAVVGFISLYMVSNDYLPKREQ